MQVLVVTDDDSIREEVEYGFPEGTQVAVARDSREAFRTMQHLTPDVVIVEIRTGSAGGFGLGREMRQTRRLSTIPILMLLERTQDEWLAREAGANATLVQPIETTDLVAEALRSARAPLQS